MVEVSGKGELNRRTASEKVLKLEQIWVEGQLQDRCGWIVLVWEEDREGKGGSRHRAD